MRISRISVYQLDVRLGGRGYGFADGRRVNNADATVVQVDTDDGLTGWGELTPLGQSYLPSFGSGARAGIGELAPSLLGLDPTMVGTVNTMMDRMLRDHAYVKSPIDMACWDIFGRSLGVPVHKLLGGRRYESLTMYGSVSQDDPESMAEEASRFRDEGYQHIQVKVGQDPHLDVRRLEAVAAGRRDNEILLADANRGWRRDDALRFVHATRNIDYVLEQPCDGYVDNLSVRRRADNPFKLDEGLQGLDDIRQALSDDAMDVACIKISKFGGLTKARLARDVCAASGIPMTVEDVWGCEIVTAALGHLAISTPEPGFLNTTDLQSYNTLHLGEPAAFAAEGRLYVRDNPGLGVEPDRSVLGKPVAVYS